jgi:hypothetical protein
MQKRETLSLTKKCVVIESIQELEQQKRELPAEYRFILLDEAYETLQQQCNEETLTYYGEVTPFPKGGNPAVLQEGDFAQQPDEQQSDNQHPDLNTDNPSNPNKDNSDFLAPAVLRDSSEATGGYDDPDDQHPDISRDGPLDRPNDANDPDRPNNNQDPDRPNSGEATGGYSDPDNQQPDLNTDDPSNPNIDNSELLAPAVLRDSGETAEGYATSGDDSQATGGYSDPDDQQPNPDTDDPSNPNIDNSDF